MLSVAGPRTVDILPEAKRQRLSASDSSSSDEASDDEGRRVVTRDLRRALEAAFMTSRPLHEQKPAARGHRRAPLARGSEHAYRGERRLQEALLLDGALLRGAGDVGVWDLLTRCGAQHHALHGDRRACAADDASRAARELRKAVKPEHRYFSSTLQELVRVGSTRIERGVPAACRALDRRHVLRLPRGRRAFDRGGGAACSSNFSRQVLGYKDSPYAGHVSPIAAYHEATDSFLMMDVAIESYPCCWVPSELLFRGMLSMDQPRDARSAASASGLFPPPLARHGHGLVCPSASSAEADE